MKIGESLKQIRNNRKKTQMEVCKGMKISQTYLSQVESGLKEPSSPMFRRMCRYYKVPYQLIVWQSVERKDIQKEKLPAYDLLKPSIDKLIGEILK